MLVVDANVAVAACAEAKGFEELGDDELVAPSLMWSEFFSLTHELSGGARSLLLTPTSC